MSQKKLKRARRLDTMRFKKAVKAYEEEQKRLEEFPPFVPPTISPLGQALEAAVSLIAPAITHAIPPRGTYVAPPQADSAVSTNLRGNALGSYQTPVISTAFVTDSAAKVTTAPARAVSTRSTPKPVAPPAPPKKVTIPISAPSVRKLETASVVNIFSTYAIDGAAPLEVDATSPTVLGTQVFGPPDPSDPDQLPTIAYIDKLTGVAKPVTDMSGNPILNGSGEIAQWVLNGRYTLTRDGNDLKIGPVGVRNLDDSLMVTSVARGYFSSEINAANSGIRLGTRLPATLFYPNPAQSITLSEGSSAASAIAIPSSDIRGRALVATTNGGALNLSVLAGNGVEIETYPIDTSFDSSFSPKFYKGAGGTNFVVYKKGGTTFNKMISSQDVPANSASAGIPAGSTLAAETSFTLPTGERFDGLQVSQPTLEAATTFIPCVLLPAGHIESPLVPQAELYFQTNRDTNLKILPNAGSSLVVGGDECSELLVDGGSVVGCNKFSGADFSALGDLTPVTGSQREAAIDDLPSSDSASTDSTFGGVVAANGQKVSCPNCVSGIEAQEVATILTEDYEAPSASASITSSASKTRSSSKSKTASLTQSATTTTSITGSVSVSRSASSSNSRSNTASLSVEQTSTTSITSSDSGSGSQTMTGSDSNSASASGSGSRSASSSNSRSNTASPSAEQTSSTSIPPSASGSSQASITTHSASSSLTPSTKESEVSIPSTTTSTSQGKSSAFNKTWQVVTGVLAGIAAVTLGVLGFRRRQHQQAARGIHNSAGGGNGENEPQAALAGEGGARHTSSHSNSNSERGEVPVAPSERGEAVSAGSRTDGQSSNSDEDGVSAGTPLPEKANTAATPQTRPGIGLMDKAGHLGAVKLARLDHETQSKLI